MSFDGLIAVAGILAAAVWLMWGINRLMAAWTAVQNRVKELDHKRIDMARELMKFGDELLRQKRDEKETGDKLATLRAQISTKTKEIAGFVPPPAQEILVSSEYPSTRDDKAWIIAVARSNGGNPPSRRQYLVWARDHAGAQNRAHTVLADQASGYEIAAIQRYS